MYQVPSFVTMMMSRSPLLYLVLACALVSLCQSFTPALQINALRVHKLSIIESEPLPLTESDLDDIKADLVKCCKKIPKPGLEEVTSHVQEVESLGEQVSCGVTMNPG